MPTYEYECEKCKKQFELFQSMKDAALATCPQAQCQMKRWGKGKVRRLLGAGAGLIFKGSGFYITDYRGAGYAEAAKKDSASSTNAASTSPAANGEPAKSESPRAEKSVTNSEPSTKSASTANREPSKNKSTRRAPSASVKKKNKSKE